MVKGTDCCTSFCSDLPLPGGQRPLHDRVAARRASVAAAANAQPLPHQTEGEQQPLKTLTSVKSCSLNAS